MARKRKLRNNRNTAVVLTGIFVLVLAGCFMLNVSAEPVNDGTELNLNSLLTYEIVTSYDGVDVSGAASDNTHAIKLYSDRITVKNQIPRGMTFNKFTFPAEKYTAKNADGVSCKGSVTELSYDNASHTVNYFVEGLQAGCEISVGVVVRTPQTIEDDLTASLDMRRDFYNYAEATENGIVNVRSNLLHGFIGNGDVPLYKVNYEYTGAIPSGAPALPEQSRYTKGALIEVASNPVLPGYTFSGWSAGNIAEGTENFLMPDSDVTLTGVFIKNTDSAYYKVSYRVDGDKPTNYVAPATKTVAAGSIVRLDNYTKDYDPDNYGFSGWMTNIAVDGLNFVMPEHDVEIVGSFYPLHPVSTTTTTSGTHTQKYAVTYKSNLPAGCKDNNTAPAQKSYIVGSAVHISGSKPLCDGYEFKGWQIDTDTKIKFINEDYFEMPDEDIVLRAVWSKFSVKIK